MNGIHMEETPHDVRVYSPERIDGKPFAWTKEPRAMREVMLPDGEPAFELLLSPKEGLWKPNQIAHISTGEAYTLSPESLLRKDELIDKKRTELQSSHLKALERWVHSGWKGEMPPVPSFFDGPCVRVDPRKITVSQNPDGEMLHIPHEDTSYFAYAATREKPIETNTLNEYALPAAMCGVITVKDKNGTDYLLYTVRTTKPESYQGFFHMIGGVIARPEWFLADPMKGWLQELKEEAGIDPVHVHVDGVMGIAMDRYSPHPEFLFRGQLSVPLEEYFSQEGNHLIPNNQTDKESEIRAVPWERDAVRSLIVADADTGTETDFRPWVPTGLLNLLLAGKREFGDEWYEETQKEYVSKLQKKYILNNTS